MLVLLGKLVLSVLLVHKVRVARLALKGLKARKVLLALRVRKAN